MSFQAWPKKQVKTALFPSLHKVELVDFKGRFSVVGIAEPWSDVMTGVNDLAINEFWPFVDRLIDLTSHIFNSFFEDID